MKKTLTALAIAGSLTFLGGGAAQAGDALYPAPAVAEVSDSTPAPGETFTFSAAGFIPGETIVVTISFVPDAAASGAAGGAGLGGAFGAGLSGVILPASVVDNETVTADENGSFSLPVTLNEEGTYTLTAVGQESGVTKSATVEVSSATAGGAGMGGNVGTGADDNSAANNEAVANGDRLAETGFDSSALLWGGAGVLALGAGATAVVVSRRKNA
ncbi:LPXTG cell wall anchor domain-containing protein [Arthrobacter crystallopoietes]|uniref:LPXTG-motif cell wall anchor domain-containing protein n=1 Tax=Crystallibacter crystallopoietes TaxID=37928 RepID=A0A1H0ZRA7_9MICC|nr:LPXTG cell wall anchor domain-containing protein [Arthrobacter crystallopoietes]AUI51852.1 hypothetical protein AC20117_14705 [Arthrobacter crystallopoietes]SDQ29968.1 LPXTG-motif cell wall anchor domain-containing protein [Arthrobacter crystallopoietes]